jgi:hypothetical protein
MVLLQNGLSTFLSSLAYCFLHKRGALRLGGGGALMGAAQRDRDNSYLLDLPDRGVLATPVQVSL